MKKAFDKLLRFECLECIKIAKSTNQSRKDETKNHATLKENLRESGLISPTSSQKHKNSKKASADVGEKKTENESKVPENSTPSPNGNINEDSSGLLNELDVPRGAQFSDVLSLKNHLNYVHKLKLCDLCLTHNKLFPHEYSYYDSSSLMKHMKEGEPKTSHRGHPNCKLCHDTFFNLDELLLHMSREHFHCHICARQDTNLRYYFMDYTSLREHFKSKHFLCERGNCRVEQFTSAFENNIEYQFHVVNVHGNPSSSRGESRQQRTITLEPTPHRATNRNSHSPNRETRQDRNVAIITTGQMATANNTTTQRPPENILTQLRQQRLPTRNEFPALGQNSTSASSVAMPINTTSFNPNDISRNQIRRALQNSNRTAESTTSISDFIPNSQPNSLARALGGGLRRPEQLNQSDFPPLPVQPKPKTNAQKKVKNQAKVRVPPSDMTLDQLIRDSLVLSSGNSRSTNDKTKGKAGKNVKHKPLKIQLS